MAFIATNPLSAPMVTSPPSPPSGTRGIFAGTDGWYDIDSDGNVKKLGEGGEGVNLDELNRFMYYGDSSITPSDAGLFDFTPDDTTMTASVKASSDYYDSSIGEYTISGDIIIPYEYIDGDKTYKVTQVKNHGFYRAGSVTKFIIPETVTQIGKMAFCDCFALASIKLPSKNTFINEETFSFCTSLTSINIPDGVTTIGTSAFASCNSITDIYYKGTEAQWNEIAIGTDNEPLINATKHFEWTDVTKGYVDSEIAKVKITVDDTLSDTSTNPVQNKVVKGAINNINSALVTQSDKIATHDESLNSLNTEMGEIYPIVFQNRTSLEGLSGEIGEIYPIVFQNQTNIAEINATIGEIDNALDSIISIQNSLIGGDSV